MSATATAKWGSVSEALRHAASYMQSNGTWFTPEVVAQRMFDLQCCHWHASNSVVREAIESGEAGWGHCTICGGWTAPNQDNLHQLCKARDDRGVPTPVLDSRPLCSCHPCTKARGEQ